MVREKWIIFEKSQERSGKSQGILGGIFCTNHALPLVSVLLKFSVFLTL